ncbi:MAG: DksA/TraR family C4-type zinc finger protein [Gammaproteobacteria bacterium]|nr:DksA/TraR family C4-type zinc finger protein [Gammaproteobacteria bacterium]
MAGGWTRDGAVQEQIDASVEDAITHARRLLPEGEGLDRCEDCDEPIPEARRRAIPGVRLCVGCQSGRESGDAGLALFNRRGSKDSQLR